MRDFPAYGVKNKKHRIVRQQSVSENRKTIQFLLFWIVMLCIALFFIQQRVEFISTQRRVKRLMLEKRKLNSSILPLKIEEEYLTQLDIIEKISKKQLNLQLPQKNKIIKLKITTLVADLENSLSK